MMKEAGITLRRFSLSLSLSLLVVPEFTFAFPTTTVGLHDGKVHDSEDNKNA
jgi:hypothetical protein